MKSSASHNSINKIFFYISLISGLCSSICPSAIAGFIVPICILPIESHAIWPIPHVCVEIIKFHPSVANGYSSSAIIREIRCIWIEASHSHGRPSLIRSCHFTDSALAMGYRPLLCGISSKAPTGFCVPGFQFVVRNFDFISAIATTKTIGFIVSFIGDFSHNKSCKSGSGWDYLSRHNDVNGIVLFSGGRSAATVAHHEILTETY